MSGGTQSTTGEHSVGAGEMQSTSEGRCGYTHEASAVTGLGGVCCWRPVWGDTGRCIWHADVGQKPTRELEEAAPGIGERLDGAIFRDVELSGVEWLAGHTITDARFVNANLEETDLSSADLRYSHFEGVDAKGVDLSGANLEHVEFDRTDLRDADLGGARLHYAVFENARIGEQTVFGTSVVYEEQLLEATEDGRLPHVRRRRTREDDADRLELYEAAHWTYNELQRLAENNGLTATSREYYRKRKDVRRREAWAFGSYPAAFAQEAWRWTTGYGASPWRVIATAGAVIVSCAFLFPLVGEVHAGTPGGSRVKYTYDFGFGPYYNVVVFLHSLYFSIVTFATLGYGDMQPVLGMAKALAASEALLGQLLMALLVFVLTRNVTWSE